MTSQTGLLRGKTIELERTVPEMDGERVHVLPEPMDEEQLSARQQHGFWQAWAEKGPDGPIEDGINTESPVSAENVRWRRTWKTQFKRR